MINRWADSNGLPTKHALSAAARVATLIDSGGNRVSDARETYWHTATGGVLPPDDLAMGEALLVDVGLAVVVDGMLHRTPRLDELLDGDDEFVMTALLLSGIGLLDPSTSLGLEAAVRERIVECVADERQADDATAVALSHFDATLRTIVGDIGEEHVMNEARRELTGAGHERLARTVRRVSDISDAFGYDITAPRVNGPDRLLEVKSTTTVTNNEVTVFISRHEANIGSQRDNWALVICHVHNVEERLARSIGWLRYADIEAQLPIDPSGGRWESASLTIQLAMLSAGFPSAFL